MVFERKVDPDEVLRLWNNSPKGELVTHRAKRIAKHLNVKPLTITRIVSKAEGKEPIGLSKSRQKSVKTEARQIAPEAAQRILRAIEPITDGSRHQLGIAIGSGLILAEVITSQRAEIQMLSTTVSKLSVMLGELMQPAVDPDGHPQPLEEALIHRCAVTAERLVNATVKLQEARRDAWGIRKDQGPKSYADQLAELDESPVESMTSMSSDAAVTQADPIQTPHPSSTPPVQNFGTLRERERGDTHSHDGSSAEGSGEGKPPIEGEVL